MPLWAWCATYFIAGFLVAALYAYDGWDPDKDGFDALWWMWAIWPFAVVCIVVGLIEEGFKTLPEIRKRREAAAGKMREARKIAEQELGEG